MKAPVSERRWRGSLCISWTWSSRRRMAFPPISPRGVPARVVLYVRHEKSGKENHSSPLFAYMPAPPTLCALTYRSVWRCLSHPAHKSPAGASEEVVKSSNSSRGVLPKAVQSSTNSPIPPSNSPSRACATTLTDTPSLRASWLLDSRCSALYSAIALNSFSRQSAAQ